ncbi:MAG TPA: hypothetical protein G4O02_13065 [Caldilineae bacterium]|nr:hypothetical protein [Caldilineae bacterium]
MQRTHRQLPVLITRAALPIAVGIAGLALRAGLGILRGLLSRPSPLVAKPTQPAPPRSRPRFTVYFWGRREVWDGSGLRTREETRARWEIHEQEAR